jgi:hypothetical protein
VLKVARNNAYSHQNYFSLISNEEALEKRHSSTLSSLLIIKKEDVCCVTRSARGYWELFTYSLKMDANVGFSDSVLLENESEAAFIGNLQLRFKRDLIFVSDLNFNPSLLKFIKLPSNIIADIHRVSFSLN